jgi:DNA-binding NtrC family response regulator
MDQPSILVFESAVGSRQAIREPLVRDGFALADAFDNEELTRALLHRKPDLVIFGPEAVDAGNVVGLARQVRQMIPTAPLLVITSRSSEELAIASLKAGINEYVKYPFRSDELLDAVRRCLSCDDGAPCAGHAEGVSFENEEVIVGHSTSIREVKARLARVGPTGSNVLVTGETGTGKELVAELVHRHSHRSKKPFVTINCAAIPDSLLESELFGYEKGAFTGAQSRKQGKLEAADGGTVFLDEIGDMSSYCQAKILRLIEGKEIQRLGAHRDIFVDVRIIAATNQDLDQLVRQEKFRKDLFFRLNVARIHLPPLRERKEDICPLINHYMWHFNHRFGRKVTHFSDDAFACLLAYDWPGNVRELKNLIESIVVEGASDDISVADLPPQFRQLCRDARSVGADERARLLWALSATNWNKSRAADKLQWSRMTLYRKMARYNISRA